jgi:hypothetical protein
VRSANRHEGLNRGPDRVAREHHEPPRQAVGPDAADQDERGAADRQRRKDEAELGGAAPDLEDRERERDADHDVSDRRGRLSEPEQAEGPLGERARALAEGDHVGDVVTLGRSELIRDTQGGRRASR